MKIAILDDYQDIVRRLQCFAKLQEHVVTIFNDTEKDPERLARRLAGIEALVLMRERTAITPELLRRLPDLRLISQTGRGIAHIDLAACTQRRVIVSAANISSPSAPAELTWGLILCAARSIPQEVQSLREGHWQSTVGLGLRGRNLGIFGFGRIGCLVAEVGRSFGMRILVWGREGSRSRARSAGFDAATSKHDLFKESDVLSLHLTLNEETREIVGATDLALMKSSAILINTSRAQLIAEGALMDALQNGRPGFAAVDVYEEEPVLGGQYPLLHTKNAICTPHLGVVERGTYELYFGHAFDQVLAYAAGNPIHVLNTEALA
jgi:D-3-phosphoglycerate dehydrogenase